MPRIDRNGLPGLALRLAVIGLAAVVFGWAPKPLLSQTTGGSSPIAPLESPKGLAGMPYALATIALRMAASKSR